MYNTILQVSKKITCAVALLLFGSFAQAQDASQRPQQIAISVDEAALTPAMQAQVMAAKAAFATDASGMSLVPMYVPVRLNIPLKDDGTGGVSEASVLAKLCQLKEDVAPYNIHIYMKDTIRYIRNTVLWTMATSQAPVDQDAGRDTTVYDIYFVPAALNGFACSYTSQLNGYTCIATCSIPIIHEGASNFGYWSKLRRTYNDWVTLPAPNPTVPAPANSERVDGSNCTTVGDLICDTAPDYLYDYWTCVNGFSATTYLDPVGVAFRVDGSNYMSNSACQSRFTPQQVTTIFANNTTTRAVVVGQPAPTLMAAPTGAATNLAPINNANLTTTTTATLSWSPVPNATLYLVELGANSLFTVITKSVTVANTTLALNGLTANKTYYWRVRPLNQQNMCLQAGASILKFKTAAIVGTENTAMEAEALSITPNPVQQGQTVLLDVNVLQGENARLLITNIAGQVIQDKAVRIVPQYQYEIDTADLPKGIHFVRLQNETGVALCKMVVL